MLTAVIVVLAASAVAMLVLSILLVRDVRRQGKGFDSAIRERFPEAG